MILKCFLRFVPFFVSSDNLSISAYIVTDFLLFESNICKRLSLMSVDSSVYSAIVKKWKFMGYVTSFLPLDIFPLSAGFFFLFSLLIMILDLHMYGSLTFSLFSCNLFLSYTEGRSFLKYLGDTRTF